MTITNKEQCLKTLEGLFKSWVVPELDYQIEHCKMSLYHPENFSDTEKLTDMKIAFERITELKSVYNILDYLKENLK